MNFKIIESLDDAEFLRDMRFADYYCRKDNCLVHEYEGQIVIQDLTNALKVGKDCAEVKLCKDIDRNRETIGCVLGNYLRERKMTLPQFFRDALAGRFPADLSEFFRVYKSADKGVNTFSPFATVKPITAPSKWTLPHVWKAILAGQITSGKIDQITTDDYAYDAAVNFHANESILLQSFARELIESPSGWWVYVAKETEDTIQLSVSCHSFDLRTLYFDKHATPAAEAKPAAPAAEVAPATDEPATPKQLWALHCITRQDTRAWAITKAKASELIDLANQKVDIRLLAKQYATA